MTANPAGSASQLVDRLVNDAQFRESLEAAPTLHDKGQVVRAAGYGDVSVAGIQEAAKKQLAAMGAGVQVDPERAKRVEELFVKAITDQELQQALQAATTPEAKRAVLAQAGYGDITLDDLRAAAADLAQREELSDDELEAVAGGWNQEAGNAAVASIPMAITMGAALGSIGGPVGQVAGTAAGLIVGVAAAIIAFEPPPPSEW